MSAAQPQVVRYADAAELADHAAARLLSTLIELQDDGARRPGLPHRRAGSHTRSTPCWGSRWATRPSDPARLELWWGDERFVPTGDPERNAGPTLALLAGHFPLDPSRTHPSAERGRGDRRGGVGCHLCQGVGATRVSTCACWAWDRTATSPRSSRTIPPASPRPSRVIGVSDAPKPPPERISLTIPTLNESSQVWFLVSGAEKSNALSRSLAGDTSLPAGRVAGRERTLWLVDQAGRVRTALLRLRSVN